MTYLEGQSAQKRDRIYEDDLAKAVRFRGILTVYAFFRFFGWIFCPSIQAKLWGNKRPKPGTIARENLHEGEEKQNQKRRLLHRMVCQ